MTALPLIVAPVGILDVSRPARAGMWARIAVLLTDAGLALLVVFALPVAFIVVGTTVGLVAQAIVAIAGRVF